MKKITILLALIATAMVLLSCSKPAATNKPFDESYESSKFGTAKFGKSRFK